jgi:putative tricarboxylic transport membrane protein
LRSDRNRPSGRRPGDRHRQPENPRSSSPGGGWDQTGRALQAALQSDGIVKKITVDNKGGAGGTIGIAQFVSSSKGDPNALMMGGMVMVGAIISNKSPVNLSQVTPIARLTGEYEVVVVPGNSKIQSLKGTHRAVQGQPGQRGMGRRFRGRLGSHPGRHDRAGIGSGAGKGQLHRVCRWRGGPGGDHGRSRRRGNQRLGGIRRADQVGKLRALGISADKRVPGVDIPTLKEQGVDVEMVNWRAVFAAPGINDAQKKELIDTVGKAVKTASWQDTLKRNEWTDMYLAGDQFKAFLDADTQRIEKIIAGLGMKK